MISSLIILKKIILRLTRPISERDFAVSKCLLQNIIIFIFRKLGQHNAKSDSRVNRSLVDKNQKYLLVIKNVAQAQISIISSRDFLVIHNLEENYFCQKYLKDKFLDIKMKPSTKKLSRNVK